MLYSLSLSSSPASSHRRIPATTTPPPPENFFGERSGRNQKWFLSPDLSDPHSHSPPCGPASAELPACPNLHLNTLPRPKPVSSSSSSPTTATPLRVRVVLSPAPRVGSFRVQRPKGVRLLDE
ncbi:hypothetical protein Tco_0013132 [Tanacetum coccineum]